MPVGNGRMGSLIWTTPSSLKFQINRVDVFAVDGRTSMYFGPVSVLNLPNLKKEADGKYHIHHVNNGESDWDSSDTPNEIGAMSMIFPLAIKVSEMLAVGP